MIQGQSSIVYRVQGKNQFVSYGLKDQYEVSPMHVDISLVTNDVLDIEVFRQWREDLADAEFILEDGQYRCGSEVEKMSKRLFNVVNPDDVVEQYGADTLRLYEMFLGPLEQSKPWNTNGIDGVFKFLRKLWRLFHDDKGEFSVSDDVPTNDELKVLHKTIKKAQEDIESYSFNTSVSSFMICVNELTTLKCNKRQILSDLLIILSPFAPHVAEELWQKLGNDDSIVLATFPVYDEKYLIEDTYEYPVSINGKVRTKMNFSLETSKDEIEKQVLADETVQRWTEGKTPKRVIVVPKRIVNIVI